MNTKNKIRWAILGAGRIANAFAKEFLLMQNAELAAVASSDKQKAFNFAKEYNIPKAFKHDELYNSTEIDAVYIATINNFNFKKKIKIFQSNKAIMCEKPITIHYTVFQILM